MHERMASCVFFTGQHIAVLIRVGQVVADLLDVFLPLIQSLSSLHNFRTTETEGGCLDFFSTYSKWASAETWAQA
jgi:hypothetical protein